MRSPPRAPRRDEDAGNVSSSLALLCRERSSSDATLSEATGILSRGDLPPDLFDRINGCLPDLGSRVEQIYQLSPDVLSYGFHPDSEVPIAVPCLMDALQTITAARYALFECLAHGAYYRTVVSPPIEMSAISFERFYVDDVAHRLYAAAEHIANGLIFMLQITDEELKEFKAGVTSQQAAVGHLLLTNYSSLAVSKSIGCLVKSTEWSAVKAYRDTVVHAQPPLVSGLGIVYKRKRRWRTTPEGGRYLAFGGGDAPDVETSALIRICEGALPALLAVWDASVNEFMEVSIRQGAVDLQEGTLRIRDYFKDKLT
jgi:hypothetical protein